MGVLYGLEIPSLPGLRGFRLHLGCATNSSLPLYFLCTFCSEGHQSRLPTDLSGGAISESYISLPDRRLSSMRAARQSRATRIEERNDGHYVIVAVRCRPVGIKPAETSCVTKWNEDHTIFHKRNITKLLFVSQLMQNLEPKAEYCLRSERHEHWIS